VGVEGLTLGSSVGEVLGDIGAGGGVAAPTGEAQTCVDANNRLAIQFQEKPNIRAFVCALTTPAQDLTDALNQLLTERGIDTAVGAQLDVIGKVVDEPRDGEVDDVYRRFIRARIAVHRSNGVPVEILKIARLVLGDSDGQVQIRCVSDASYILEIHDRPTDADTARVLIDMVGKATSAGVRVEVVTTPRPLSEVFRLDISGQGVDQGHLAAGADNSGF